MGKFRAALFCLVGCGLTASGSAQSRKIEISPFAGVYFNTGFQAPQLSPSGILTTGGSSLQLKVAGPGLDEPKSGIYGFRGSYDLTPRLALEGTFGFSPAGLRSASSAPAAVTFVSLTDFLLGISPATRRGDTFHYHGNLVYHWRKANNWSPFLTGGWGAVQRTSKGSAAGVQPYLGLYPVLTAGSQAAAPSDASLAINFGGGVKKYFADCYGLRLDFRDYLSRPLGDTVNNLEVSLGLIFRFR